MAKYGFITRIFADGLPTVLPAEKPEEANTESSLSLISARPTRQSPNVLHRRADVTR